jgi:hypothetical protein
MLKRSLEPARVGGEPVDCCGSLHSNNCLDNTLTDRAQVTCQLQQPVLDKMARGAVAAQLSGMASNPYPRPKTQQPMYTECELCDRTLPTKVSRG